MASHIGALFYGGISLMKEIWVCLCGQQHLSKSNVLNCECTRNGYTHGYQCENCGSIHKEKKVVCCSLFKDALNV